MDPYLQKPIISPKSFNPNCILPYELTIDSIFKAIDATHELLNQFNTFLVSKKYPRLEELMLGNSFAGLLSEVIVKNLADNSRQLVRNIKIGGYPDLIPKGKYLNNSVLRGEGIEIKTSKQPGRYQGHNPEEGWIMIFRYSVDTLTEPIKNRSPAEIQEVMAAKLDSKDWSFSGRTGQSRRTITASIIKSGMNKLRENIVYSKTIV